MAGARTVHESSGTVYVTQEDGTAKAYGPGDSVPAADAEKITNPKVWGESAAPKGKES